MPETLSRIQVRYAETDRMGVVHHAVYPVYFEVGRTDYCAQHLLPYHEMEARGLASAVIEVRLRLHAPATYGDELALTTRGEGLKGIRFSFTYRLHRTRDGALVATGFTEHALVTPDGRPAHPRRFGDLYELFRVGLRSEPAPAPE